jgi:hypothetical protein
VLLADQGVRAGAVEHAAEVEALVLLPDDEALAAGTAHREVVSVVAEREDDRVALEHLRGDVDLLVAVGPDDHGALGGLAGGGGQQRGHEHQQAEQRGA